MLDMRLDSFGKNRTLNTPGPSHGTDVGSERSALHQWIHGKGGLSLGYRSGRTLPAPGYMCIYMNTYRLESNGLETELGTVATRFLALSPSFPFCPSTAHDHLAQRVDFRWMIA